MIKKHNKNFKIAFEGVDGAGKSTLAKMLYDKLFEVLPKATQDSCIQNFPTKKARERLKTFDSLLKADPIILANIFLDDYCDFLDEIDVDYIIMDRCPPLSSLVYQPAFDSSCRDYIYSQVQKIECPDILFYLYLTEEEAVKRITNRTDKPKTQLDEFETVKLQQYIDLYEKEFDMFPSNNKVRITMNDKTQNEVFDIIINELNKCSQ